MPKFGVLFVLFAILALPACLPSRGTSDDPPVIGLAEAQANDTASETVVGSTGDPADTLEVGEGGGGVETAAVEPERRGLFALFGRRRGGAASAPEVAPGTVLPFAEVASVCGVSPRKLGREVDEAPKTGRARFALIDTAPGSTIARTQYITGFSDRCARQFTGALVLFGSSDVHETTRYAQGNTRPYSATDEAYEQLKSRICGVRRNVPCPTDRHDRLNGEVVFVTIYPRFGVDGQWFELLLSDGRLQAQALGGT